MKVVKKASVRFNEQVSGDHLGKELVSLAEKYKLLVKESREQRKLKVCSSSFGGTSANWSSKCFFICQGASL